MIENYKYSSPFKILISFHKLIEGLQQIALSNIDYRSNYAKGLLQQIENKPEFVEGIENLSIIKENEELIQYLLADLFPSALTHNEIKAATVPFYDITFNYSERFKKIIRNIDSATVMQIRDMNEHQFYVMSCTIILNAFYQQNVDFGKPLFYDIPDENGVSKHYRILYNADFLEILPTEHTKFLDQKTINNLIDNYDNLTLWKEAFPEKSWILKGFAIVSLVDVTIESAVSNLKSNLLKSDIEKSKLNKSFESIFRSVFKIADLKIGFTFYDEEEDLFKKPPFSDDHFHSFILLDVSESNCKNALCGCTFETLLDQKKPFVISNVKEFAVQQQNNQFATHLLENGIQSYLLAPVVKDDKLLGLIELASTSIRALNSVNANKLELILPYLTDTVEKNMIDMANQLEAIIQKEYTAIHSSVYWKFKKEAKNYFYRNSAQEEYHFKEIVFKEVYPLYGQIDIKGSSENRLNAIKTDLNLQITHIIEILNVLNIDKKISVIEQKKFELQNFLDDLKQPFQNNSEQIIHHYIETEIHSFFKNTVINKKSETLIAAYFAKIDPKTEMFYQTRKDFDETIMSINKKLAAILDAKQEQAQEIFPHYYERFKTDGVEHNLYIGASIEPNKPYNAMYLHNLRLWQLETLCEMELEHHKLKETLPYSLDVTSLILAFSSPISIRFRMDEKRFDVDGSYNARYEVVKKRIDKAYVKNSTERITQKEKITIVYSNSAEENEYIKYIHFLQHKNLLEPEIEKLEVEDLQAVSGLKALRVKVKHHKPALLTEATAFITTLFIEKLDAQYTFHNFEHTKNVVNAIEILCDAEQIEPALKEIILLAGWFHDAGYVEGSENHEQKSIQIAKTFFKNKNISAENKQLICDLIHATTYDYQPKNLAEKIIRDADTSHLATETYLSSLEKLRKEWEFSISEKYADTDWIQITIDFLKEHQFYTNFAATNWQNYKMKNLYKMQQKLQKQFQND